MEQYKDGGSIIDRRKTTSKQDEALEKIKELNECHDETLSPIKQIEINQRCIESYSKNRQTDSMAGKTAAKRFEQLSRRLAILIKEVIEAAMTMV